MPSASGAYCHTSRTGRSTQYKGNSALGSRAWVGLPLQAAERSLTLSLRYALDGALPAR